MITIYDKIGLEGEHPTKARITGEIHMDFVPVTHNKREWIKESEEYIKVEAALIQEFKEIRKKARERAEDDKLKSPRVQEEVENWKDSALEALKTPEIKSYFSPPLEEKLKAFENVRDDNGDATDEIEIERRETREVPADVDPKSTGERKRGPKKTQKIINYIVKIKGKKYKFNHEFFHLGKDSAWKEVYVSDERGIEIITNQDFPAFLATKDIAFYAVFHIAEGLSEVIADTIGLPKDRTNQIKELILKKASEIKNQLVEKDAAIKRQLLIEEKMRALEENG